MMEYVADFETTTDRNDCRVWAWSVCEVADENNIWFGNRIETFVDFMQENNGTYYFHNAVFDFEFLAAYLMGHLGFECAKKLNTKKFTLLMSEQRKFYNAKICFSRTKKGSNVCEIRDSYKKLPFSVDTIAKDFGLDYQKLDLNYQEYREPGHELTEHEIEYISNDVKIVACALRLQLAQSLNALTIGADALRHAKSTFNFKKYFPVLPLELDAEIRKSYRGGYTYVSDIAKGRVIGPGCCYDKNSMYPSMMVQRSMPVGYPTIYDGRYTGDKLHIQRMHVTARLRDGFLPTLQIKRNPHFMDNQYVEEIVEPTELCLTSVDFELFKEHYIVDVVEYHEAYVFKSANGIFDPYIEYWMHVKETSTGAIRMIAKLMLNSLYGKLATNPDVTGRTCMIDADGVVRYPVFAEPEYRDPVYTAAAAFITAYARQDIISHAQNEYNRFLYADTDSLHLEGLEIPSGLEIHKTKLGAWDHEYDFEKAKYPRQKTYIEVVNGKNLVKCAGLSADMRDQVRFEDFDIGLVVPGGKLVPKHVPGGIVLVESDFTIR